MRALGSDQLSCLRGLCEYGYWEVHFTCGWTYGNCSHTTRIMNSLVRRGLATCAVVAPYRTAYTPTAEGREASGVPAERHGYLVPVV